MFGLLIIGSLLGSVLPLSPHLEVSLMLNKIADQYSPPLVISFLHERIRLAREMIENVLSSYSNLDSSKRDNFNLGLKSLQILDQQLTAHEKADHFDANGTQKVKDFIGQFTIISEMFPVHLDFDENLTVDSVEDLIASLNVTKNDLLIEKTNKLIDRYIKDMEEKESSHNTSRLQKLSANLAKTKLLKLFNSTYSVPYTERNCPQSYCYSSSDYISVVIDKRADELKYILRKVEVIVKLFYSKFNYLTDVKKEDAIEPVMMIDIPSQDLIPETTTFPSIPTNTVRKKAFVFTKPVNRVSIDPFHSDSVDTDNIVGVLPSPI